MEGMVLDNLGWDATGLPSSSTIVLVFLGGRLWLGCHGNYAVVVANPILPP